MVSSEPSFFTNLSQESDFNWKQSAALFLLNPLALLGVISCCHTLANFTSVIGTTTLKFSLPNRWSLTTIAGRNLLISCPLVGLKSTIQISHWLIVIYHIIWVIKILHLFTVIVFLSLSCICFYFHLFIHGIYISRSQ